MGEYDARFNSKKEPSLMIGGILSTVCSLQGAGNDEHALALDVDKDCFVGPADLQHWVSLWLGTIYYEGVMDEVRIYRRMLSEPEVQLLHQEGRAIEAADLNQDGRVNLSDVAILHCLWLTQVPNCPSP